MPDTALLFARTELDAVNSAVVDWRWEHVESLHIEFRRPDNNERVRFVPDTGGRSLIGLRWGTKVYLGFEWDRRHDAHHIRNMLDSGFFKKVDPQLPPPRPRRRRDELMTEVRQAMVRLETMK